MQKITYDRPVLGDVYGDSKFLEYDGSCRAFTEHVEKLAELVKNKTGGKFTLKRPIY